MGKQGFGIDEGKEEAEKSHINEGGLAPEEPGKKETGDNKAKGKKKIPLLIGDQVIKNNKRERIEKKKGNGQRKKSLPGCKQLMKYFQIVSLFHGSHSQ
ncbi:MAG: hypothetical protein V1930_06515 [Pseudomonadota bacterium]